MGVRVRLRGWPAVLLLYLLLPAAPAMASQGIGVSPTSQEVQLQPGTSTRHELTVINDGDTDVTYRLVATDYRVTNENYQGDFSSSRKAADVSAVSWFLLPVGTLTVKARQQVKQSYTIVVPPTAVVGGHYAAVFVETVPPPGKGGTFISRVERIGSLFYLAVAGDLKRSGSVLPLSADWLQALSPIKSTLRVRNDGNVHFLAEGTAQLSTPFGEVGTPEQFRGEVLPGTTRRFALALPAGSPIGLYKVSVKASYLNTTKDMSRWVLLVPRLTFIIVSGTLVLLIALGFVAVVRRARRR